MLHCAADQSLVSGGERGEMAIFDLRQRKLRETWGAHSSAVHAVTLADGWRVFSASADAELKLWAVDAPLAPPADSEGTGITCAEGQPRGRWAGAHEAQTLLSPLVGGGKLGQSGVTALTAIPGGYNVMNTFGGVGGAAGNRPAGLISGGADGKVKLWRLI